MSLLAYTIMVIFAISGNSSLLALVSIPMTVMFAFLYASWHTHAFKSYNWVVLGSTFLLALTVLSLSMPQSNALRFLMAVFFLLGAALLWIYIIEKPTRERARFFEILLRIYIIGALIQVSGVMGPQMETFKAITEQPLVVNLERESNLAILGTRYFGFFSEPSYFALHYCLLCAALYLSGAVNRALTYFLIGVILSPSPSFLFGMIVVLYAQRKKIVRSPRYIISALVLAAIVAIPVSDRLSRFVEDVNLFLSGRYALTSFSQRLVLPIFDIIDLTRAYELPLPYSCMTEGSCPASLARMPLLTFWAFFTIPSLIFYLLLSWKITGERIGTVFFFLILATIFSGGSAFLPHFALVFISSIFILGLEDDLESRKSLSKAPPDSSGPPAPTPR